MRHLISCLLLALVVFLLPQSAQSHTPKQTKSRSYQLDSCSPQDFVQLDVLGNGTVGELAWSSNNLLAMQSSRGVWVYDVNNLVQPPILLDEFGASLDVDFSPDGHLLASSYYGQVVIWNTSDFSVQQIIETTEYSVIAFSPDGESLAISDIRISGFHLWGINTYHLIRNYSADVLNGFFDGITNIDFNADGSSVVMSGFGSHGTFFVWNIGPGVEVASGGSFGYMQTAEFHPNENIVAYGAGDNVHYSYETGIADLNTDARPKIVEEKTTVRDVAFSPSGEQIATASGDFIILRNLSLLTEQHILQGHQADVVSIVYSPTGHMLASSSGDGTIRLWDLETLQELVRLAGYGGPVVSLAFSPTKNLLVAGSLGMFDNGYQVGLLQLWDLDTNLKQELQTGRRANVNELSFSKNGNYLAASKGNMLNLYNLDLSMAEMLVYVQLPNTRLRSLVFMPDRTVAIPEIVDSRLQLKTIIQEEEIYLAHYYDISESWYIGTISPDGRIVVLPDADGNDQFWNLQAGERYQIPTLEPQRWNNIAFSHNGKVMLNSNDTIIIWDSLTNTIDAEFEIDSHWGDIDISNDGQFVLSTNTSGDIFIWDIQTHQNIATLHGHVGIVHTFAFSPDNSLFASGSRDGTIRLWGCPE